MLLILTLALNIEASMLTTTHTLAPSTASTVSNGLTREQNELLTEAIKQYAREVTQAIKEHERSGDFDKRNISLFLAYYRFVSVLTKALNPLDSCYIYPVPGPDVSFQMHSRTFRLNIDSSDSDFGADLLLQAGIISGDDTSIDDYITDRMLLTKEPLDAYSIENYQVIERPNGMKFILVMKGFVEISRKLFGSENTVHILLEQILNDILQIGDEIIIFTEEDQEIFDSIATVSNSYELIYRDDNMSNKTYEVLTRYGMPKKLLLIPKKIAIYRKVKEANQHEIKRGNETSDSV